MSPKLKVKSPLSIKHKLLISGAVLLLGLALQLIFGNTINPWMNLWYHRFGHILGGILFVGNVLVGAYWMIRADMKRDPIWFAETIAQINLADLIFTIPGALLVIINGEAMSAVIWSSSSMPPWFTQSLYLFIATGVLWAMVLVPIQILFERQSIDPKRWDLYFKSTAFTRLKIFYFVTGGICGLFLLRILLLMVVKTL